ncbi:MAG: nucleoside deaminase [Kiritimatiellales bacterium]
MNEAFMREAIALSIQKMEDGEGGPFGAVIVKDGEIIGRGWNRVTSINDPTAHAEIVAIRDACAKLKSFDLAGCEIYASCEPCPMCLAAIYWARLDKLTFAATRTDAADAGFDDEYIYSEICRSRWSLLCRKFVRASLAALGSKDWKKRALPVEQGLQNEAHKAFEQWKEKTDRTAY